MGINFDGMEEFADSSCFGEARHLASEYHGGQWSDLYKLSCGKWDAWERSDVEGMILEFEKCKEFASAEDESNIDEALDCLLSALEFYPEEEE